VIVETTDANGSLHSSYLLVNSLDAHSIVANLVVAIYQQPQVANADSTGDGDEYEESKEDADQEIKAQIYLDCHPVGTVTLAGSLKQMIQLSTASSSSLRAVRVTYFNIIIYTIDLGSSRVQSLFYQVLGDVEM
jgi:hypothetical protein